MRFIITSSAQVALGGIIGKLPHRRDQSGNPACQAAAGLVNILIETIQTLVLAVVLYMLIDSVMARVRVDNISMQPTLHPGEFILVNKFEYKLGEIHRGDIIVFHYPLNPSEDYIKRVIGIPGDTVTVSNTRVMVNNQTLTEPYISAPPQYTGTWQVPEGKVFVLGDNRNQSSDSHSWGFVPSENIVGRALVIYWPLEQFKILTSPATVSAANN